MYKYGSDFNRNLLLLAKKDQIFYDIRYQIHF